LRANFCPAFAGRREAAGRGYFSDEAICCFSEHKDYISRQTTLGSQCRKNDIGTKADDHFIYNHIGYGKIA